MIYSLVCKIFYRLHICRVPEHTSYGWDLYFATADLAYQIWVAYQLQV